MTSTKRLIGLQKRFFLKAALLVLAIVGQVAPCAVAQAQSLTIVVGALAGGPLDLQARALASALQTVSGRPVMVQNRPGDTGNVAAVFVANTEPSANVLLLHDKDIQSHAASRLQPVAYVSETALGIWRTPLARNTQPNVAFPSARHTKGYFFANQRVLGRLFGGHVDDLAYIGVSPAMSESAVSGNYVLAELSNHDIATRFGMQLVITSSASIAKKVGLSATLPASSDLREFVIPVGLYAPQGTVAAGLREDVEKAIASTTFQALLKKQNYVSAGDSLALLFTRVNHYSDLIEAGIAAGASDLAPPTRLAQTSVQLPSRGASVPASALPDDPKTVGRSMRGGEK